MPTFQSPSVARITRFTPPLMKFFRAISIRELDARCRHSSSRPLRAASARRISALSLVDSSTQPLLPAYTTMATRSSVAELVNEQAEALFQKREPLRGLHRAGDIDEKDEVARRAFVLRDFAALEPDADEPVRGRPRARGDFHRGGERRTALRLRVVVGEVVQQLLDPHRALRRELLLIEETAHDGVARGVHIGAEGRERILADGEKGVVGDRVEGVGGGGVGLDSLAIQASSRSFAQFTNRSKLRLVKA